MCRGLGAKGTGADRDVDVAIHARANGRQRRCHRGLRLAAALALALRAGCRAAHCSARALRAAASTEPSRSRCRRRERARFELASGLPEPLIENYHARSILLVRSGEQAPGWIADDTIAVLVLVSVLSSTYGCGRTGTLPGRQIGTRRTARARPVQQPRDRLAGGLTARQAVQIKTIAGAVFEPATVLMIVAFLVSDGVRHRRADHRAVVMGAAGRC